MFAYDETITRVLNVYEEVNREVPLEGLHWFFDHRGRLRLLASRGGDEGSLVIHHDVRLYDARLSPG